jgi:GTP cyclohydrolase I
MAATLIEVGEAATFNGPTEELEIQERLDAAIAKCLKQLLMVRGVKSITAAPSSESPKRVTGPSKAA